MHNRIGLNDTLGDRVPHDLGLQSNQFVVVVLMKLASSAQCDSKFEFIFSHDLQTHVRGYSFS